MDFQIATSGLGQKTGVFSVNEGLIRFRDKKIITREVRSIATSMFFERTSLSTHLCVKLLVKTDSDTLKLSFTGTDAFYSKSVTVSDVAHKFFALRQAVFDCAGPFVLDRLIQSLTHQGYVTIGSFTLSPNGISYKSSLRGETRAKWDDDIEMREDSEPPTHKRVLEAMGLGDKRQHCDRWSVYFRNRNTAQVVRLGGFSFDEDNGYFLLFLIPRLKTIYNELP